MKENCQIVLILLCWFLCTSCDKNCSNFSEEQLGFLLYEKGEQFKLKNELTGDTITYTVTEKEIGKVTSTRGYLGNECSQVAIISFSSVFDEKGEVLIGGGDTGFTSSISIKVNKVEFKSTASFSKFFGTLNVKGNKYENVYSYTTFSKEHKIYLSKEKGFLKIDEITTGKTLYTIVE